MTGRRRWLTNGIAAFGVSSLILSGLAGPASALDLPNNVELEQWADVAAHWTNGSLGINGAGASTYAEGETVPFHLDVTSAGVGTFDFSVCRDFMDSGIFGYLRLAPYDTSFNGVLSLLNGSITDAADGDHQPFTGAAVAGSVTINSVNEVGGPGTCGAGQRETEVQISIAAGPGGDLDGASVLWGGRLASPADPGVGGNHGAGFYPGASLSMRLGGSAKNVGIKTDAIIQLGTINVQKVVDSGTATADQFCFNISPNPNGVALPQCPATGTDTVAFLGLPTGNYTVTEAGVAGYSFVSGAGSSANCGFVNAVATASVTAANEPVNAGCVFHNRRVFSTLTINQVVDPGDDPGKFNLQIDGSTAGTGVNVGDGGTTGAVTVSSGGHSVGNTAGAGTDLANYDSSTRCTANGVPVALDGDEVIVGSAQDVVCTITMVPKPIIIVDPLLDPDPTPGPDPTVDPHTEPGDEDEPDRCASSRGGRDCDDDHDPNVEPEEEEEVVVPPTPTTTAPVADPDVTVSGGGDQVALPAPVDQVLSGEVERTAPAPAATLPRTGIGIGRQVTLAFGLMGAGIVSLALARRRRPAGARASK